ncbi:sortase [Nitrolancea hollandica]|uniref:Putative Sortase family protein n=1 Tax=Nitrolancea hollandica Lb TaxID=1129897 RepID=I4EES9_9BACT|nr:sortase [Nitrolancea hollandica]CCF83191.1 putative Sortase family protein [Nitrolancea hollandica Lb]
MVANAETTTKSRARSRRRKVVLGFLGVGGVLLLVIIGVGAFAGLREWRSPSGKVFVQNGGDRVELQMPMVLAAPPAGSTIDLSGRTPQPPERVDIPRIGVHAEVFLMTKEAPRFKAAGWQFGSAMPGTAGNVVLYGARSGDAAVFTDLDHLQTGDEVAVSVGDIDYVYRVASSDEVDAGRTDLLMPTDEPMVTLITDAGQWDSAAARYDRRLVIRGRYTEARAGSGT